MHSLFYNREQSIAYSDTYGLKQLTQVPHEQNDPAWIARTKKLTDVRRVGLGG